MYMCPVCGYSNLKQRPRAESGVASRETCPGCGFQFGVTDDEKGYSYQQWRQQWIDAGASQGVATDSAAGTRETPLARRRVWMFSVALLAAAFVAYWPAIDNHFISDDYVILDRVEILKRKPLFLLEIPPDTFRATSYFSFGLLKKIFGYRSQYFYVFNILLHAANSVLFWRFLVLVTARPVIAALAALLFATVQNPQEAVFWLTAMNETLVGLCVLLTLLLWIKGRIVWSVLLYILALFSKESAVVVLFLLPMVEVWDTGKFAHRREYACFLGVTLAFVLLFAYTSSANPMLTNSIYVLGPHSLAVLAHSLHKLAFPWLYLAAILSIASRQRPARATASGLLWMLLGLLPYVSLTYQNHVPSRHLYMSSMGLALTLALLVGAMKPLWLQRVFLAAFVAINVGYIWLAKDPQYERRAAVTSRLVERLQSRRPAPLLIVNFPSNIWIAKLTTQLVPGWRPEIVRVNEPAQRCRECWKLRWDPQQNTYVEF